MTKDIRDKKIFILEKSGETIERLKESKEKIPEIKRSLINIEEDLEENIQYLNKTIELWQAIPDDYLNSPSPAMTNMAATGSNLVGNMSKHSLILRDRVYKYSDDIEDITSTMVTSGSTTSSIHETALSAAKIILPFHHEIEPVIVKCEAPSRIEQRKEISLKLKEIKPLLDEKFDGAWQTLNDKTNPDRSSQAAHSMREVLSDLEHILAPDDLVKETEWYKKSGKKKVIQRFRVKYAIIGDRQEEEISGENIEMITKLMDEARRNYEELNSIAHNRKRDADELCIIVESYLVSCQNIIKAILELRKKFFNNLNS